MYTTFYTTNNIDIAFFLRLLINATLHTIT
jgi:hypothetical protein